MAVRDVSSAIQPPIAAPGHDVAAMLKRIPVPIKADQLDAGDFAGFGTTQLFKVPPGFMVREIVVDITEAFTASVTMTIGDEGDPDRFMDNTVIVPTAAGMKSSKLDASPGSGGVYVYATGDTIDLVLAGATPSAGTIDVWLFGIFDADDPRVVDNYSG